MFDGYLTHAKSLGALPAESSLELMRMALAAASLQLALLPPGQFMAWTWNFARPALNLFLAGDNAEQQVTGRIFSSDVRTETSNRLYVETQRAKHALSRSMLDFEDNHVLRVVELYFERSVQVPTRLFELDRDEFLIVQGMPRADRDWIAGLTPDSAQAVAGAATETIEHRNYRFHCGCDPQKVLMVVRGMFAKKPEELFEGDDQVEVQCPRCGRSWVVTREEFNARRNNIGFS